MPILQDEIWRKTQKLLVAGRMRSTLFGYRSPGDLTHKIVAFLDPESLLFCYMARGLNGSAAGGGKYSVDPLVEKSGGSRLGLRVTELGEAVALVVGISVPYKN